MGMIVFILLHKPVWIRSSKLCSSIVVCTPAASASLPAYRTPHPHLPTTFSSNYPYTPNYVQHFTYLLPAFTTIMVYTLLDPTQKEIRLLHLAPALNHDDLLVCSFGLASFDEDVDYEALLYA
jgi:hypothetical protein